MTYIAKKKEAVLNGYWVHNWRVFRDLAVHIAETDFSKREEREFQSKMGAKYDSMVNVPIQQPLPI